MKACDNAVQREEAPFSGGHAFAQRDSDIAGNASWSQCDAAIGMYTIGEAKDVKGITMVI